MASNVSITLSTIDRYSKPFKNMTKSAGALNDEIKTTSTRLKALEKNQQSVARFKKLSSQLEVTKIQMVGAKVETSNLQRAEISAVNVVKEHTARLKDAEKAVLASAQAYGVDSKEVKLAAVNVKKLTTEKNKAERLRRKETASLKKATSDHRRLTTSFKAQSTALGGLRNKLKDAGLNLKALNAEELRLARNTKRANHALEQQSGKLRKIQKLESRIAGRKAQRGELMGDALSVAVKMAPMMMAGKQSMDYEATFANVRKVVNFKDDTEANSYKQQMLKKAGALGMSQEGLAQIVTAAGQSGIEKDQLIQFAESAARMSVAWDVSAEEAGSTLATWRASMGLSQETALDLADATNYLSNNMNAKAKDIASVMVRQGSTAMGAGLTYNNTAALAASLLAGGATNETAATALKNISGRLTAGYAATGAQQTAFEKIGFDAEELAVSMQEDAQGTIVSVMRALQDVDASERGAVISQIFGEEVKGAVSKLVLTIDDPKNGLLSSFARVAKATDRTGSVNAEFALKETTRAHQLEKLKAKSSAMMIAIGDRLLPVLDTVLPPLMTLVDGIASFATNNKVLTTGILGVVGAFGVLSAGLIAFKLAKGGALNILDTFKIGKTRLSGTTDVTAKSANLASRALSRVNRELAGISRNGGRNGGYGSDYGGGSKRAGKQTNKRRTRRPRSGKFGRIAGLFSAGAALSMFSSSSNASSTAMAGADIAGAAGGLTQLLPAGGKLLQGVGKLFRPLDLVLSGAGVTSAISSGDNKQIGASVGDMAGGLGGAAAGAMAGAALGSVVPILGTAVGGILGGIIGGFGGGELGQFIGESVGGWFGDDKNASDVQQSSASNPVIKGVEDRAESAARMSVAWDVSAEEAGSTLATWRASMGLSQETALDLADATNYLSNNMNAKAKDIASVMVRQGSTAMGAGLTYNNTAALAASLLAGGATNETAATALKNISGRLTAGYAATGAQQTAFEKIGFDAEELAVSMQEDAQGTIVSVMRALQDVDASERGAVISQIFGEEVKGAVSKLVLTIDDPKNGLLSSFARVAGLFSAGAALSMFSSSSNASSTAMAGADIAGAAGGLTQLLPAGGKLLQGVGKLFRPLDLVLSGAGVASAISSGDNKQVDASVGDMAGGLGGAAAGAMAGAVLGSVVPILGTAVGGILGGIVGGFGGGELGQFIGESIGGWFGKDKTAQPAPKDIAKQAEKITTANKQINYSPTLHFTPTGDPEYDNKLSIQIMDMFKAELSPLFLGNDVAVRSDASLTDGATT